MLRVIKEVSVFVEEKNLEEVKAKVSELCVPIVHPMLGKIDAYAEDSAYILTIDGMDCELLVIQCLFTEENLDLFNKWADNEFNGFVVVRMI